MMLDLDVVARETISVAKPLDSFPPGIRKKQKHVLPFECHCLINLTQWLKTSIIK